MDGRIDDPKGGWKGRGLWATISTRTPFHMEDRQGHDEQGLSRAAAARSAGEMKAGALMRAVARVARDQALVALSVCCRIGVARAARHDQRRVAHVGRRSRRHPLRAARSDQRRELQQARSRVALQDREPRRAPRLQPADDAADGQRRALRHRRRASQRRRARRRRPASCCGCTGSTKASARSVGAPAVGPRRRLLDRRQGRRARSSTSRSAISWSASTRRPACRSRTSASTASSI